VELREPRHGSSVRGEVPVSAAAPAEGPGLKSLLFQFSVDGRSWRPLLPDPTAPADPGAVVWDTRSLPDSPYLLRAVAADNAANLARSKPVAVRVDNTPPQAALLAPARGAVLTDAVRLFAEASDPGSGVGGVRFEHSRDGQQGSPIG